MFNKFQNKLSAAFFVLVILIIAPVLVFVNSTIDKNSVRRIEASLRGAEKVLQRFLETKKLRYSEASGVLISTHPVLRALLGSASADADLFSDPTPEREIAVSSDRNGTIFSAVESLGLYRESGIFLFTDSKGKILFSKASPSGASGDLGAMPIVQAALRGRELSTLWSDHQVLLKSLPIFPKTEVKSLYEVFLKPISFGREVKGLLIAGFPVTPQDLAQIKEVTEADVAFLVGGEFYLGTAAFTSNPSKARELTHFVQEGQEYLALPSVVRDGLGQEAGTAVLFRSKTREMAFFRNLKWALNLIALGAAVVAVLLSLRMSRGVTGAIRTLMGGVKEIRSGNLQHEVRVPGSDEFASLADAFNVMTSELREKEAIKATFKRYINPKVASSLLEQGKAPRLGGERRQIVAYFADIAGFTSLAEQNTPEETVEFLNNYLSKVTNLIESSEGIVDKYIGDAVVAYWMARDDGAYAAELACHTALEHCRLAGEVQTRSGAALKVRIGVHRGEAILGNIGSETRMEFTLIGDDVNVAQRLEAANKSYGSSILVSHKLKEAASESFWFRELDVVRVDGRVGELTVLELCSAREKNEPMPENISRFAEALASYRAGDFSAAEAAFGSLLSQDPSDVPLKRFVERCSDYAVNPPANWKGVQNVSKV